MSKIKNVLALALIMFGLNVQAQFALSTTSGEAANGQTVTIDVVADQFTDLTTFQFQINWDPAVMTYQSISNLNGNIGTYSESSNFGLPGNGSIMPGELSSNWIDPSAARSLPAGSVLFSVTFQAVGAECATTNFTFTNLEAADENFSPIANIPTNGGELKVSGADCGGGGNGGNGGNGQNDCEGSTLPYLTVCDITASTGSTVCVPVKAYNFTNIDGVQTGITYDASKLTFTSLENFAFGVDGFFVNGNTAGEIRQFWTDPSGNMPQTIADGAVLYELCFEVLASNGTANINIGSIGSNFDPEIVVAGSPVEYCLDSGVLTVGDVMQQDPIIVNVSSASADQGSEACVDFTVRDFNNMQGLQFAIDWDESVLTFDRTDMYLTSIGINASRFVFEQSDQTLRFAWDRPTAISLDDDTKLFRVCFDVIGDCANTPTSPINIISVSGLNIEAVNGSGQDIGATTNAGSISVNPCDTQHSCEVGTITSPNCPGDSNGSIAVTVQADNTCQCAWYEVGNSSPLQVTPGNEDCSLNNVGAGNYRFELANSDGAIVCTFDAEIVDPQGISFNPQITSAGCGDSGAVTLNATGGTGALSYAWTPNVSTGDSASGLAAQEYTVVVTDTRGCTSSISVNVTAEVEALSINADASTIQNVNCFGGSDGSVSVSVAGGCPEYSFAWSNGNGENLSAGDYTVTVTDSQGNTASESFTITQPEELGGSSTVAHANGGDNGSITIIPTGGTEPFTYMWNPNVSTTGTASNLAPGNYSVTITDANDCEFIVSDIEVLDITPGDELEINNAVANDVTTCNGNCTGSVTAVVSGGAVPYTITLSGASTATQMMDTPGSFTFNELCAGTYTIAIQDADGASVSSTSLVVAEPTQLTASIAQVGPALNDCDGFIMLNVSGGTAPYTVQWSNSDFPNSVDVTNVCQGSYNALITDANGCEAMVMNITVAGDQPVVCNVGREIITPNSDGFNDFFTITCVQQRPSQLLIFDRWGREVYTNDAYDNSFNGISSDGEELPEGGYMWVLNIDYGNGNRELVKGTLTILR